MLIKFLFNYKLIQFKDNAFGVRRGWIFYGFKDFVCTPGLNYWWGVNSEFFKDCSTSESDARSYYNKVTYNYRFLH